MNSKIDKTLLQKNVEKAIKTKEVDYKKYEIPLFVTCENKGLNQFSDVIAELDKLILSK